MSWRLLECSECEDSGWTNNDRVNYCGNCAGDCGTDVRMRVLKEQESPPTQEELREHGQ